MEIRPIVDKPVGRWYLAFHRTLDRPFHGYPAPQGVVSPNFKAGYDVTKKNNAGFERYGSMGRSWVSTAVSAAAEEEEAGIAFRGGSGRDAKHGSFINEDDFGAAV